MPHEGIVANNVSAERSLVAAVLVSVAISAIASQVSALGFGSFRAMSAVLIAANILVYLLTKIGLFSRQTRP